MTTLVAPDASELLKQLADPMWRLCSGKLYKIMVKGDDSETDLVVPFMPNRAQRRFMARLWNRNLILKARQLGFTTLMCILWLDHALFNSNQRCGIIAQDREAAETIFRDKVKFAYERLPPALLSLMPLARDSASELLFAHNNSSIRVATSMRSGTIHRLHVSEFGKICAKFPDKANEVTTGSIPAVPKNGIVVIESTAEGRDGAFFAMSQLAQAQHQMKKELTLRDYRFHFYAWWQAPEYRMSTSGVIRTPKDDEYFLKVEAAMGTTLDQEQRAWYVATRDSDFAGQQDKMWQEYPSTPDEAFQVSTEGTYYAVQLAKARTDGRITTVAYDPSKPVNTFWDIGNSDEQAIWLHQSVGLQDHFIGYIEGSGEPPSYYVGELQKLGYVWGKDFLPHDGAHRQTQGIELKTYARMLSDLGRKDVEIVPRIDDVTRGIQITRDKFGTAWFDEKNCSLGLSRLQAYRKEWNARLGVWSDRPRHDTASNGADAFRQWAQAAESSLLSTWGGKLNYPTLGYR